MTYIQLVRDAVSTLCERDVVYGCAGTRKLLLDIMRPAGPAHLAPAVIEIPGGAFLACPRDVERSRSLAEAGFFTASVAYRLANEACFPAQIHDVKAAVRWLRANAATYHIDPDRIGVWGFSSGATLAALLGTSGDVPDLEGSCGSDGYSSRVQAVLAGCPMTDTAVQLRLIAPQVEPSAVELLLGGPLPERVDVARQLNPLTYAGPSTPPFLIIHGDADENVHVRNSELLYEGLVQCGCDATFVRSARTAHNLTDVLPWDRSTDRLRLEFFTHHLGAP